MLDRLKIARMSAVGGSIADMSNPYLLLALLFAFTCGCESQSTPATKATPAKPVANEAAPPPADEAGAPDSMVKVQYKSYEGVQELIESHQGKVVVMDCWSTWCEPCVKEFPGLVKLHEKYGADKVACISVCFDYEGLKKEQPEDYEEPVLKFLREQHAAFDNVIANEPSDELYGKFGFPSVPAVFVYDRQGKLAKQFENKDAKAKAFTYQDVDTEVARLLK
ncbi:MAG TPA: redoxin domain-containing protein [Pirellulales bacterium]|nr:redoxin domain-containing protein [Pirellulales bacterium]